MDTVKIKINGQDIEARPGQTILEVVEEQKLDRIPTLCHSAELDPYGSCFLCVVEVKGRGNLLPSCATRVAEGMEIETRNERIIASRKSCLELLLSNHYADCVSPCNLGCPAGVDAQGYIALAAMGEYSRAVNLVRETNPLPAICGRVCVRKCEMVCRRDDIDGPVGINNIKRYVTDMPGAYDSAPEREPSKGKTIGIVGAGPAGLTAAWFLGLKGYDVVLYESMPMPGGMLRYGIPEYRLPKADLDREIKFITDATGAQIKTGVHIGRDITLVDLQRKHDAVFVAAGAWAGNDMGVEGERDTEGVVTGVDFLIEKADKPVPLKGTIVVVGGGNTAMDAARTSWRLGADKVILLYRRTKAEMPADKMEIEACIEEGIEIMELAAPVGLVKENNRVKALKCIRMKLGEPDASGRRRPVPMEGSEFELPCNLAISAIGQHPLVDDIFCACKDDPVLSRWGTVNIDTLTTATSIEGLFAGGDAADDGPTVVIDAIRDGQRAAKSIHAYLSGEKTALKPFVVEKKFWSKPGQTELGEINESPRHEVHEIPVDERKGKFVEVATGYEYEDTMHECDRCLACGCIRYDDCALRLYAGEYGVDMEHFKGYIRKHKVDDRHPYIAYDPNKCILCARCIRTCDRVLPISALGLMGRGFKTEMRPAMNDPLAQTNCVACGNCVDSCPTGALLIKYPFPGRACLDTVDIPSHCGFCSVGCPVTVKHISDSRYYISSSGDPGDYLCRYGRFGNELFIRRRRKINPLERDGSSHNKITWDEAYAKIASGLKSTAEKHGPQSVAVFVSPELTNEELYIAARIARDGIGTNNIGSLAVLETGSESGMLDASFGFTASTSGRDAVKDAGLIICNNTDTETDQLVLSVEIIDAVKHGAKLIVSNSSKDPIDPLASIVVDPFRGRASLFWNGVIQVLIDNGTFDRDRISALPGGDAFIGDLTDYSARTISELSGVEESRIVATAEMVRDAKRVVFVHSPDRPRDQAPGDMAAIANFVILLRAFGIHADLLLPRVAANGAGMEITGADAGFAPGRVAPPGIPGAKSHAEFRSMLSRGDIKAALIIGEDPMRNDATAFYFRDIEFLAAMDWTSTETTVFADISIPGTTCLEEPGTRMNFEGALKEYADAVRPPSGLEGWRALSGIAAEFGLNIPGDSIDDITAALENLVKRGAGEFMPLYWNTGQPRGWNGTGILRVADVSSKPRPIAPPLSEIEQYKYMTREVDIEHFRVQDQMPA